MIIGVPKETKNNEYRVSILPVGVETLVKNGHKVFIEREAGVGSGITDEEYKEAGAKILNSAEEIFARTEIIIKIKEPLPQEYSFLKEGQIVFTYFHFAADRRLTET